MYAPFFGLKQEPFSIAPDPRYLFMSDRHREALAHLLYGVGSGGGFVLLTGEIGAGKTTVCRCFLEQIPRRCNVAYIFNPKLTVVELLQSICDEFHVPVPASAPGEAATVKHYLDPLNEFLLRTHAVGQNNVLIIDEAQNLSADVLEQLRLLTNLETSERKLLQIILIGQPELRTMLARPELEQLAQRVIARYHLGSLSEDETAGYVRHRLAVAGLSMPLPFTAKALKLVHRLSGGVPRRINLLCDRALLGAYASNANSADGVDAAVVRRAAAEVFGDAQVSEVDRLQRMRSVAILAGIVAVVAVSSWALVPRGGSSPAVAAVAVAARAASTAASTAAASASTASTIATSASAASSVATITSDTLPPPFRDDRSAWRELAGLWKLQLGDGEACAAAAQQQVQCYRATVGLDVVRQLDRPAILFLRDDRQRGRLVLLTGLDERSATLQVEGASRTVPIDALARVWRGEYATLWRSPPGFPARASEAAAGPLVDWLNAQLTPARAGGDATADLKSRVYAFQVAQGIRPDGIAGPTTFMQLNRAIGLVEPKLSR